MHANYDTETVTCMRGLNDSEIRSTSMNVIFNDRSKLKGECTDVKIGSGTSVGPGLNPHSLSLKTFLVTLSLLVLEKMLRNHYFNIV